MPIALDLVILLHGLEDNSYYCALIGHNENSVFHLVGIHLGGIGYIAGRQGFVLQYVHSTPKAMLLA